MGAGTGIGAGGSGSAEGVSYAPGVQWGATDHSGRSSFGWYLSQMLNADLSIVARGGIGLTDGTEGKQEETESKDATMLDIYPYASGHNQTDGLYDFARKPDLVVIELGANDTVNNSDLRDDTRSLGYTLHHSAVSRQRGSAVIHHGTRGIKHADDGCAHAEGLLVQLFDLVCADLVQRTGLAIAVLHKGEGKLSIHRAIARQNGIIGLILSFAAHESTGLHKGSGIKQSEHFGTPLGFLLFKTQH